MSDVQISQPADDATIRPERRGHVGLRGDPHEHPPRRPRDRRRRRHAAPAGPRPHGGVRDVLEGPHRRDPQPPRRRGHDLLPGAARARPAGRPVVLDQLDDEHHLLGHADGGEPRARSPTSSPAPRRRGARRPSCTAWPTSWTTTSTSRTARSCRCSASYFDDEEYEALTKAAIKQVGLGKQAAFTVPYVGYWSAPEDRAALLAAAPLPFRVLYRADPAASRPAHRAGPRPGGGGVRRDRRGRLRPPCSAAVRSRGNAGVAVVSARAVALGTVAPMAGAEISRWPTWRPIRTPTWRGCGRRGRSHGSRRSAGGS